MFRQVFRHIEHGNLALTAKYNTEFVVCIDHSAILAILEFVLPDIVPDLFNRFCTGERFVTYYGAQSGAWGQWSHERSVRLTLGF